MNAHNLAQLLGQALADEAVELSRQNVVAVAGRLDELLDLNREQLHAARRARAADALELNDHIPSRGKR